MREIRAERRPRYEQVQVERCRKNKGNRRGRNDGLRGACGSTDGGGVGQIRNISAAAGGRLGDGLTIGGLGRRDTAVTVRIRPAVAGGRAIAAAERRQLRAHGAIGVVTTEPWTQHARSEELEQDEKHDHDGRSRPHVQRFYPIRRQRASPVDFVVRDWNQFCFQSGSYRARLLSTQVPANRCAPSRKCFASGFDFDSPTVG